MSSGLPRGWLTYGVGAGGYPLSRLPLTGRGSTDPRGGLQTTTRVLCRDARAISCLTLGRQFLSFPPTDRSMLLPSTQCSG